MEFDHRRRLIKDLLDSGAKCSICHRETDTGARVFCARMLASRGQLADPYILRQNYLCGCLVCHRTSGDQDVPCAIEAANRGMIDFDYAVRVLAEGRAHDEKCPIITFPHMSDSDFLGCVVVRETLARIDTLVLQIRPLSREIADALDVIGHLLDSQQSIQDPYTPTGDVLEFSNPFKTSAKAADVFDKCLNVFAVREDMSMRDESTWTIFARAILTQFARQLGYTPSNLPPITFPLQIARAKKDTREVILRIIGVSRGQISGDM